MRIVRMCENGPCRHCRSVMNILLLISLRIICVERIIDDFALRAKVYFNGTNGLQVMIPQK